MNTQEQRDSMANSNLNFEAVWCYSSYLRSKLRLKGLSRSMKYIGDLEHHCWHGDVVNLAWILIALVHFIQTEVW